MMKMRRPYFRDVWEKKTLPLEVQKNIEIFKKILQSILSFSIKLGIPLWIIRDYQQVLFLNMWIRRYSNFKKQTKKNHQNFYWLCHAWCIIFLISARNFKIRVRSSSEDYSQGSKMKIFSLHVVKSRSKVKIRALCNNNRNPFVGRGFISNYGSLALAGQPTDPTGRPTIGPSDKNTPKIRF